MGLALPHVPPAWAVRFGQTADTNIRLVIDALDSINGAVLMLLLGMGFACALLLLVGLCSWLRPKQAPAASLPSLKRPLRTYTLPSPHSSSDDDDGDSGDDSNSEGDHQGDDFPEREPRRPVDGVRSWGGGWRDKWDPIASTPQATEAEAQYRVARRHRLYPLPRDYAPPGILLSHCVPL